MKPLAISLLLFMACPLLAQTSSPQQSILVADAARAIAIARPAAIKIYGKGQIASEEPLTASLEDGVWSVYGTLCCTDAKGKRTCEPGKCVGGVVKVAVRQSDGKILSISHTM